MLGEGIDLQLHGVVPVAVIVFKIEADFHRIAKYAVLRVVFRNCQSGIYGEHLALFGELVVLEGVELSSEFGPDAGFCLGVNDVAKIVDVACGTDSAKSDGACGHVYDCVRVCQPVCFGIDTNCACIIVACAQHSDGKENRQRILENIHEEWSLCGYFVAL